MPQNTHKAPLHKNTAFQTKFGSRPNYTPRKETIHQHIPRQPRQYTPENIELTVLQRPLVGDIDVAWDDPMGCRAGPSLMGSGRRDVRPRSMSTC